MDAVEGVEVVDSVEYVIDAVYLGVGVEFVNGVDFEVRTVDGVDFGVVDNSAIAVVAGEEPVFRDVGGGGGDLGSDLGGVASVETNAY